MDVSSTGGWQNWATQKCNIDKTTGVNDVYFVFKGGSDYLYNINWWSINYLYDNDPLLGDCNLDGKVSIADAVMLKEWLLCESNELTCWRNVDLCKDNKINVFDFCLLKRMLVK